MEKKKKRLIFWFGSRFITAGPLQVWSQFRSIRRILKVNQGSLSNLQAKESQLTARSWPSLLLVYAKDADMALKRLGSSV